MFLKRLNWVHGRRSIFFTTNYRFHVPSEIFSRPKGKNMKRPGSFHGLGPFFCGFLRFLSLPRNEVSWANGFPVGRSNEIGFPKVEHRMSYTHEPDKFIDFVEQREEPRNFVSSRYEAKHSKCFETFRMIHLPRLPPLGIDRWLTFEVINFRFPVSNRRVQSKKGIMDG